MPWLTEAIWNSQQDQWRESNYIKIKKKGWVLWMPLMGLIEFYNRLNIFTLCLNSMDNCK